MPTPRPVLEVTLHGAQRHLSHGQRYVATAVADRHGRRSWPCQRTVPRRAERDIGWANPS
eukprot:8565830-Pyramimonas_sp.AAC.1